MPCLADSATGTGAIDSKDRQIIAAQQADGRMSNQELSERVNLEPITKRGQLE